MKRRLFNKTHAGACVTALMLSACGGGGGSIVDAVVDVVIPSKTITGVIADGLIQGAVMCYDVNDNNKCDVGEPKSSPSAADGSFSITIPASAAGKHAMIADIPATAIDSDNPGVPIGVALTMMAPLEADTSKPVFISPLTTAVTHVMIASGNADKDAGKAAAIEQVTQTLGLGISPLVNFITPPAGTDPAAALQAHANAQVMTEVKKEITRIALAQQVPAADIPALVAQSVVTNLAAVADVVTNQGTQTAVQAVASSAVVSQTLGITATSVVTQASVANTVTTGTTAVVAATGPTVSLRSFSYVDANNWNYRLFTSDNIADSNGFKYSNEVRVGKSAGVDTRYNRNTSFFDTANNRWFECPSDGYKMIKYTDATASAPSTSLYCHSSSGNSKRVSEDVSGKTITSIIDKVISTGLPASDDAAWKTLKAKLVDQTATFPANARLSLGLATDTNIPDQHSLSEKIRVFPTYALPPNAVFEDWPFANGLDQMVERYYGELNSTAATPFANGSNTDGLGTFDDLTVTDVNLQKKVNYRVAFKPTTATSGIVRYYKCRRNASNGFTTACAKENDSTYTIEAKGDGRVLRLAGMPSALVVLRNNKRIYVERAGAVFAGSTGIPATIASARLNNEAWVALRAQFPGVTEHENPTAPVAVESGSWLRDLRELATGFSYRINKSLGLTSGTGSEIRVVYNCSANPNADCEPLPAPDNFNRNRLFLVGNVWKDSDLDSACPSNGINLSTWTSNPRESVGCGGQTESITSLDSDISGRTFASVFGEGRAYSGKAYGSDTRNWRGKPSNPENAGYIFPAGSKLRFMQSTIKSASPSIGISNGNKVQN
jgi:hypothetical protein